MKKRLLFRNTVCKSGENKICIISLERLNYFKITKFQINCYNNEDLFCYNEIELKSISYKGNTLLNNSDDSEGCITSLFNEETNLGVTIDNFNEKSSIKFKFYNPTNQDAKIYITLVCEK